MMAPSTTERRRGGEAYQASMKSQGTVYSLAERQGTWHIRR